MACHRYAQAEQERLGEEERLANINIVEFSHEGAPRFRCGNHVGSAGPCPADACCIGLMWIFGWRLHSKWVSRMCGVRPKLPADRCIQLESVLSTERRSCLEEKIRAVSVLPMENSHCTEVQLQQKA